MDNRSKCSEILHRILPFVRDGVSDLPLGWILLAGDELEPIGSLAKLTHRPSKFMTSLKDGFAAENI